MDRICSVSECGMFVEAKSMCSKHYYRQKRGQSVEGASQYDKPLIERFFEKVNKTDTCWEWIAFKNPKGYGYFRVDGFVYKAHRWSWEQTNGPIEGDLTIDHVVCQNTSCVNPSHMELVTRSENTVRARAIRRAKKAAL